MTITIENRVIDGLRWVENRDADLEGFGPDTLSLEKHGDMSDTRAVNRSSGFVALFPKALAKRSFAGHRRLLGFMPGPP
jgi:hypothetical protein